MKPRTKYKKAVIAQSGHLRPLPTAPRGWAFTNTINHYAFRLPKGRTTCMDCGHSWLMNETAERCTCPNCKAKLKVKETYERKCRQKNRCILPDRKKNKNAGNQVIFSVLR